MSEGTMRSGLKLALLLLIASLFFTPLVRIRATTDEELTAKKALIDELQKKITALQSQKQSLAQTITFLSTKIQLAETEIAKTETEITMVTEQIAALDGKIGVLNTNLERLSELMVNRVTTSYKNSLAQPILLLFAADSFNDFFRRYKYLKVSQQHDRQVIYALEEARANYDAQKQVKEAKQRELETLQKKLVTQKNTLAQQQRDKQAALQVTRNDEKRYQEQLAQAMAEIRAIQSIIAGNGEESKVGTVNEGDTIATVIAGSSACSNGSHLHFEVVKEKQNVNPAGYLSGKDITWDNSPDGSFPFTGSWRWPVDDPIRITQGYGMTFYAATLRYYGGNPHTGIDMINASGGYTVRAVKQGTLYRGAIACGKGTLRYVRVDQGDNLSTYYLHVNY